MTSRTAAVAALLALPLGLAACGDGDGDKPSKDEVTKGVEKLYGGTTGTSQLTDSQTNKLASCAVDKTYDKLSTKTLKAMASGDKDSKGDKKDEAAFRAAGIACARTVVSG